MHDSHEVQTPARWGGATAEAGLPDRLGRYVILGRIGAGMMGVVYAAYDPTLDRKVAVKVLHGTKTGASAAEARRRLVREARSMARLSHAHVVPVFDAGIVESAECDEVFLAMEFVQGQDLEAWLAALGEQLPASRLRTQKVMQVFLQAGRGLAAAHDAQLVHRDFKPSNVLVTKDGTAKVTDFGLARMPLPPDEPHEVDEPHEPSPHSAELSLTATGDMLGTPAYMAPEQHRGEPASAASDQFSYCVALYEALYGQPPFEGMSYAQRALSVVEGRYIEPPADARVPAEVSRIVKRGLLRVPQDRYPNMHALVHALENAVRPPSSRRSLVLSAGAAVVLVALVLSLASTADPCRGADEELAQIWNPGTRAGIERTWKQVNLPYAATVRGQVEARIDGYARQWIHARTKACEATKVERVQSDMLMDRRMACLESRKVELGAFVAELAHPDAALVAGALAAAEGLPALALCANLSWLTAPLQAQAGPEAQAVSALRLALAQARGQARAGRYALGLQTVQTASVAWAGHRDLAANSELWLTRGELMAALSQPKAAQGALTRAFMLAQRARHTPVAAAASAALVPVVGVELARHQEGLLWADIAQATLQQHGPDPRALARVEGLRARVLSGQGARRAAVEAAQRALTVLNEHPGTQAFELGAAQLQLGSTLVDIRDYRAALPQLSAAVAAFERSLGPEHPGLVEPLTWLGRAQQGEGLMDEARQSLKRAVTLAELHLGPDHALRGEALMRRGTLHTRLNEHAEAIEDYREAVRILTKAYGPEHTLVARAWLNLGVTLHRMGELEQATEHYTRALTIREKRLGRDHPDLVLILQNLGSMAVEARRPSDAVPLLQRALQIRGDHLSSLVAVADVQYWLGRALYESGQDRRRGLELITSAHLTFVAEDAFAKKDSTAWFRARGLAPPRRAGVDP